MARSPRGIAAQFTVAREATKEETKKVLVAAAKRLHGEIMVADPKPGGFRRFVDNAEGKREEAVQPYGVIRYEYQRLELVAQVALATLVERSPVLSGAYRKSHTIFLRGQAVENLKDWRPGDEIVIVNPLPYARKIEVGKMKMRVPGTDRVYQEAEQIVQRRFGNLAKVKFTYQGVVGFMKRAGVAPQMIGGKAGNKSKVRYPALVISER
jgi:hypothetical protein